MANKLVLTPEPNEVTRFEWKVEGFLPYLQANQIIREFNAITEKYGLSPYTLRLNGLIRPLDYHKNFVNDTIYKFATMFTVKDVHEGSNKGMRHWLIRDIRPDGIIDGILLSDTLYNEILNMETHITEKRFNETKWLTNKQFTVFNKILRTDGYIANAENPKTLCEEEFTFDRIISTKSMEVIIAHTYESHMRL
ncbi:MAG: hypothetical protein NC548_15620 [Lachnospiraceae bacterium]|nr:hypothetical protein [Lachnospiraceae bacterium]